MSTRHLVDPQLYPLIDCFPPLNYSMEFLPGIRQQLEALGAMVPAPPDNGIEVSNQWIARLESDSPLRLAVYMPPGNATARPAFLHTHGGGFILGRPEVSDARLRSLAAEFNCVVVSVDYRLAPEHPFPAAIDDCYAGLKWLYENSAALRVDPARIAIGGESGGGGLSAALGLLARDREEIPIVFQLLIYPMLDDRTGTTPSANSNTGEFIWTRQANRLGWSSLLAGPPGRDGVSCYASASRAANVDRLPPTFIAVGALDLFLEENLAYAQRLLQSGVATELHVYPGACHAFDLVTEAQVARQLERDFRAALSRAFA